MSRTSPLLAQAIQLFSRGAYPQAIGLLQQAVAAQPMQLEPRLQLAKACLDWVGVLADVQLTEINPEELSGEASHYLQLAAGQLQALVRMHPASPHVQGLHAILHLVYSRYEDAVQSLKKATARDPRNPELLYNLGYALIELERYSEAEAQLSRLTALYPAHGMGWHMLGQALRYQGKTEASMSAYRKAISLVPSAYQPYGALSSALRDLGRHDEAKNALLNGLSFHNDNRLLNFTLANLSLSMEDWKTGWRYYLCRVEQKQSLPFPEEFAPSLEKGKPFRIHFDQGLGDELFFLRFAPVLAAKGIVIHYTTTPKLYPLLQGMPFLAALKASDTCKPKDFDILVGELPFAAGMLSTQDIPPPLALRPEPEKLEPLRRQLESFGPPPYLGVTWQGGWTKEEKEKGGWEHTLHKEIPSALLGELARNWPGTVVVLQRVPKDEDLVHFSESLGRPWLDWSKINDDLSDALAGLSLLDEYVGVSNTNMHLLASLGKTARVLAPYPAEWRWMATGKESPWFPGFRIYRQNQKHDWAHALHELDEDLKARWSNFVAS